MAASAPPDKARSPRTPVQLLRTAAFALSVPRRGQLPPDRGREVAFLGRSNAGKSSLLNAVTDHRSLARTSKLPGRTQHFVVFDVTPETRLIDLPGYGYAAAAREIRTVWTEEIPAYFAERRSLAGAVCAMDARRPLLPVDREVLELLSAAGVPCLVALTKIDTLSRSALAVTRREVTATLAPWGTAVAACSAKKGEGIDAVAAAVAGWLRTDVSSVGSEEKKRGPRANLRGE